MKLLFVYPKVNTPGASEEIMMVEPLSLEYLAAAVPDEHEVKILDLRVCKDGLFEEMVARWSPDIVGITGFSLHSSEMVSLSRRAKKLSEDIRVIVGGRHATFFPSSFMVPSIDLIARGEGESIMGMIVESIHSTSQLARVPGILYRDNGEWVENKGYPRSIFCGLVPSRHLVSQFANRYHILHTKCATIQVSRGCPYNCSFCDARQFFQGRYTSRDSISVVDEIKSVDAKFIYTADENIGINSHLMAEVVSALRESKIDKRYWMTMSAREVLRNRALLDQWFDIGLVAVFVGFERVDDQSLKGLGKHTSVQANDEAITYLHSRGAIIVGSFIVLPTDTANDFMLLEHYVRSRKIDVPMFCILTPFPGTKIWGKYSKEVEHDFRKYDWFHPIIPTSIPREEFCQNFGRLYRSVDMGGLAFRVVRKIGIGSWLFGLPKVALTMHRLSHGGWK